MPKYSVLWGSDDVGECGIWLGDDLVVSGWALRKYFDTSAWSVCHHYGDSQEKLAWYHRELECREAIE
jgi:hypothetical protein